MMMMMMNVELPHVLIRFDPTHTIQCQHRVNERYIQRLICIQMASASATSKVRREIQDLLGFNDYQDASGFNDWLSRVSKSNSLIKCYFQYPKLWVKLILKVANCLDLGSSSFLFESVCTAILNFFGPTACGQSSLAYIADKKPSKKGTSQIHLLG